MGRTIPETFPGVVDVRPKWWKQRGEVPPHDSYPANNRVFENVGDGRTIIQDRSGTIIFGSAGTIEDASR